MPENNVSYSKVTPQKQTLLLMVCLFSIVGPLLFITFMNDLPLKIYSPLHMYADDSTIHVTGKTILELESKLNIDLKNVQI